MRYAYPCNLHPEQPEGFYVTFPDVPGALTSGKDRAEALEMAEDALAIMLGTYVEERRDIPVPSDPSEGQELVPVPPIIAAKLELYTAMRSQGISNVALGERLGIGESAVRRLLDTEHRSHIERVERALRAVGRSLIVESHAA